MTARRERIAWLLFCAILALIALRVPTGATPSDRDLAFMRTMVELKRQIDGHYVRPVDERDLREQAIAGMMGTLDPYSEYIPPRQTQAFNEMISGRFTGVGILVAAKDGAGPLVVTRPLEGGPAASAGVEPGDKIVAVDGADITDLKQPEVIEKIKGPIGTRVTLTVERPLDKATTRPGQPLRRLDLTMDRAEVTQPVIDGYRRDARQKPIFWVESDPTAATTTNPTPTPVKVAYIRLTGFTQGSGAAVVDLTRQLLADGMQGLILDLRFNGGGLLDEAATLGDAFLPQGDVIYSAKGEHYPEVVRRAKGAGTLPDFPMVVLVNGYSASASEVLSGALGDNGRAVIVGTRTFGKGSVQQISPLSDGGEVKLTQAHYYLPSGRLVHRERDSTDWGVVPDLAVPVDENDPAEVGDLRREPLFPRQVRAAYQALVGLVATERQGTAATQSATRPTSRPTTLSAE